VVDRETRNGETEDANTRDGETGDGDAPDTGGTERTPGTSPETPSAEEPPPPRLLGGLDPEPAPRATSIGPASFDVDAFEEPDGARRPVRGVRLPVNAYAVVLTGIATAVFFGFLLIEPTPRWLLLVGAIAIIFGMDGTLRATWREPFASEGDTTAYLFLPALYVFGAPIIVEHNVPGYWLLPAGLLISAGFGAIVLAELISVRPGAPEYPAARLITTAAAYFVLFSLASMTYVFEVDLVMALVAIGLVAAMLGVEVLREGEIDQMETMLLALVTAAIVVQARWLLHYLPIDLYLAGLLLTLVFFVTTGLLHAHVQRQFSTVLAAEYTAIAGAGLALIVVARVSGMA
jgi:hypothetical protein